MSDHSKILKHIEASTDPESLKTIIKHAEAQGEKAVKEAAFRKLISIVPETAPGTVEHDFWTTVHAFEFALSEERGRTTKLSRTRQKVARVGIMATLEDWAFGKQTTGFDMLVERGMPELTGEAIVLRHADKFPEDVTAAARERLAAVGYEPKQ